MSLQIVEQLMHHYLVQYANLYNNNESDSANYQIYLQNQIKSTQTHIMQSLNERYGPVNQIIRRETQAWTVPICPSVYEVLRFPNQANLSKQLISCIEAVNSTMTVQCISEVDNRQAQKLTEISQRKHAIHKQYSKTQKKQKSLRREERQLNVQQTSQANLYPQMINQQSSQLNQAGMLFQQIIKTLFGDN